MLFVEYPKCSTCRKAKQWLKDNGIDFTDRDITLHFYLLDLLSGGEALTVGEPAFFKEADYMRNLVALCRSIFVPRDAELVLLGHGSPHRHNPVYERLQAEIDAQQLPIHVGVLESTDTPDFPMVLKRLQKRQVREVLLAPLLLTSGMHVARDMAGEGEASWKARLEKAGFSVTPILEGLGESPLFRQIYIEKARKALRTE